MTGRLAAFALAGLVALAGVRRRPRQPGPAARRYRDGACRSSSRCLPVGRWDGSRLPLLDLRGQVDDQPGGWKAIRPTIALIAGLAGQLAAEGVPAGLCLRHRRLRRLRFPLCRADHRARDARRSRRFPVSADDPRPGDQADYAALITSRSGDTAFAQLTAIGQAQPLPLPAPAPAIIAAPPPEAPPPLADRLQADGHVVLDDLSFASGSADLAPGSSASLAAIAAYLAAHPDARITIVGHTDASGAQSANLDLSRARAASVVARLIADYGVAPAQLSSDGIGALSPLTTNLTDAGRQKNRRVEAVLTSTR
ncbi:MAG: OmpA family protein [Paracoccaceae bacterium]